MIFRNFYEFSSYWLGMIIVILAIVGFFIGAFITAGIEKLVTKKGESKSMIVFYIITGICEIPCIICIYIFLFRPINPLYLTATMSSTFSSIISEKIYPNYYENTNEKTDPQKLTSSNGMVKYDVSKKLYSYEYIPFEKIAKGRNDVRFIITINREKEKIGRYTDNVFAERWKYTINLIDINNPEKDYVVVLLGEDPPQTRTNKTSPEGKPPSYQVIKHWIEETMSTIQ
jgi:hypothetical protein